MRPLDTSQMHIVQLGRAWEEHGKGYHPCSKQAMPLLEGHEELVSWLQPIDKGVEGQVAAIWYKEEFYPLSLRMMKAIYRRVRLRKDFCNIEKLSHGGHKLKIPMLLLNDKKRTQSRFHVSSFSVGFCCCKCNIFDVNTHTPYICICIFIRDHHHHHRHSHHHHHHRLVRKTFVFQRGKRIVVVAVIIPRQQQRFSLFLYASLQKLPALTLKATVAVATTALRTR